MKKGKPAKAAEVPASLWMKFLLEKVIRMSYLANDGHWVINENGEGGLLEFAPNITNISLIVGNLNVKDFQNLSHLRACWEIGFR